MSSDKTRTQVYIITSDIYNTNEDYLRLFTSGRGFIKPIIMEVQYPSRKWIKRYSKYMTEEQIIELYNHYIIWKQCVNKNNSVIIIYNNTSLLYPYKTISKLFIIDKECDITFYGKYFDGSSSASGNPKLCLTSNHLGVFAYHLNPSGAKKLLDNIVDCDTSVDVFICTLLEKHKLNAMTYNPSIIKSNINTCTYLRDNEKLKIVCNNHGTNNITWQGMLLGIFFTILIIVLFVAFLYYTTTNIKYKPGKEMSSGYDLSKIR